MSLPTLQDTLTLAPPVYLRIMDNRNDWGSPEDPIENRVTHAVKAIFLKRHKNPFSFYIVESDNDLRRIAMAYNANRHDPTDRMDFIAFLPEELKQAGLSGLQTPGGTECGYANRRHFDMEASEIQ